MEIETNKMTVEQFNRKVQKLKILLDEKMLTEEEFLLIKNKLMEDLKYVQKNCEI